MIRERLRQWAIENVDQLKEMPEASAELSRGEGNYVNKAQAMASPSWESLHGKEKGMATMGDSEIVEAQDHEVGIDSRQPGDLVELRYV